MTAYGRIEKPAPVDKLPNPYYQDTAVTIYHGDCRDILPLLPKVDLVLTDPPYNASFNENGTRKRGITCKHKAYSSISEKWDSDIGPEVVCNFTVETLAFCSFHLLDRYISIKKPHQIIHWRKSNPFPALGDYYTFSIEYILWWRGNTKGVFNRGGTLDVLEYPICGGGERFDHPTQKPISLIRVLLSKHTNKEAVVLDPFAGTGTTLWAAKDLGRKAIGIEIEEKYCEIAAKRMGQEVFAL